MKIINSAHAGTLESSDIYIQINPFKEDKIELELESSVEELYGDAIKELIIKTLEDMNVSFVHVKAQDKGAMDLVIKARLQAAVLRACESDPVWEEL